MWQYTPGVDDAVDVEVNPVMLHQVEQSKGSKKKDKKLGGGTGKSGGLKRLGLDIAPRKEQKEEGKVKSLAQLESYLASEGVDVAERWGKALCHRRLASPRPPRIPHPASRIPTPTTFSNQLTTTITTTTHHDRY